MKCRVALHTVKKKCKQCGKLFVTVKSKDKEGHGNFCSRKCVNDSMISENSIIRNGLIFSQNSRGYYHNPKKNLLLHRVIWKDKNGKIPKGYYIHHKDGNKTNNSIKNLEVVTPLQHADRHPRKRRDVQFIIDIMNKFEGVATPLQVHAFIRKEISMRVLSGLMSRMSKRGILRRIKKGNYEVI